jgi:prephenate dehydratase|tara:strand:+ start:956 stop:1765 length:810 start_codon:yes stop_codon:yes gene_type:complete
MKIAILGPKGTFSHETVLNYSKKAKVLFQKTVWDVFDAVESKKADLGIVPIENSISGTIGLTLDALMEFDLNIIAEEILPVKHNLVGFCSIKDIKTIYVHPQTYTQCEKFIRNHLQNADIIQTISNGESAEKLLNKKSRTSAAIVPKIAADIYRLKILKKDIQDSKFNITRFAIISEKKAKRTGHDRTSITIYPQIDKPGLLYKLLGEFAKRKVNLSRIESRPSKGKLGDYIFFIDLQGHRDDKKVKETFHSIEKNFFLKILGSYHREY